MDQTQAVLLQTQVDSPLTLVALPQILVDLHQIAMDSLLTPAASEDTLILTGQTQVDSP